MASARCSATQDGRQLEAPSTPPTRRTPCHASAQSCRMAPPAGTPKFDVWRDWHTSRRRTRTESSGPRPPSSGLSRSTRRATWSLSTDGSRLEPGSRRANHVPCQDVAVGMDLDEFCATSLRARDIDLDYPGRWSTSHWLVASTELRPSSYDLPPHPRKRWNLYALAGSSQAHGRSVTPTR